MNNLILDFSHVYCDERIPDRNKIHWIDCSDITECDLYCSGCAADEIWARIKPYGINGIHFLDSGNYHYVTGIITDRIDEDFVLVVFDHHTDMQKPMIDNMISCGDWAGQTLENNPYLKQLVLIGPPEDDIEQIYYRDGQGKLLTFSAEEIKSGKDKNKIAGIISIYIDRQRCARFKIFRDELESGHDEPAGIGKYIVIFYAELQDNRYRYMRRMQSGDTFAGIQ